MASRGSRASGAAKPADRKREVNRPRARRGGAVLAFDLDHQANLTFWFGRKDSHPTLDDVIRRDVPLSDGDPADRRRRRRPGRR